MQPITSIQHDIQDIEIRPATQNVLRKALEDEVLSRADALLLVDAPADDLPAICAAARELRDRCKVSVVTYSRKVFIPLTTLCRDKCGYCTFAKAPGDPDAKTLTPHEVLAIAEAGRKLGCKEALFSLGERPELQHQMARDHLRHLGYPTMLAYLRAMCELVLDETGLLPHANPGTLTSDEIADLHPVSPSMGMMLESVSERLTSRGETHFGCPDKVPKIRLDTLRAAGEHAVPFTTGILIGIGETRTERVDSLMAIREIHAEYGHIQEVIVQNFRAKPRTRMAKHAEPDTDEMLRTLAVARLTLGGDFNVQAPPNLAPTEYGRYLGAGINDWGGVSPLTPDHINPEAAWPILADLRDVSAEWQYNLRERLSVYPEYILNPDRWLADGLHGRITGVIDVDGLVKDQQT